MGQLVGPLCSWRRGTGPYWGDSGVSCIPIPIQEQFDMFNPMPIRAGFGQPGVNPQLDTPITWKGTPSMEIRLQMCPGVQRGYDT